MREYFNSMKGDFDRAYAVATQARAQGKDPAMNVEIAPASDLAARVEGLVGPAGVAERIRELGKTLDREATAFAIAKELLTAGDGITESTSTGEKIKRIEQAVRTGLAIVTEGVVSAPIEGVSRVQLRKNVDGSDYLAVSFAGPIRGAGGTGQAFAVIIADYCRQVARVGDYRPLQDEVERYVEEINLYARRTRAGQYVPTEDEIKHIANHCPVCIDGEPSERYEVSAKKNLRVTVVEDKGVRQDMLPNAVRSGVCLVFSEGICLKAAKVLKITKKNGLDWQWVEKLIKVAKQDAHKTELRPSTKYMDEIVAGRPVFSYPMRPGGFRLRYGRTPLTGIAGKAIHPATMIVLDKFPAIGTQLKIERPGKGCVVTPCAEIEGPVVKLLGGDVVRVESAEQATALAPRVEEVLFVGDLLVNYGDFLKSNHMLVPCGYNEEWHVMELEKAGVKKTRQELNQMSSSEAIRLSEEKGVALSPRFTYFWSDVSPSALRDLVDWLCSDSCELEYEWFEPKRLVGVVTAAGGAKAKRVLEELCVPHRMEGDRLVLDGDDALALGRSLGLLDNKQLVSKVFDAVFSMEKPSRQIVNEASGLKVMDKSGTYVGASMGRPEKAKPRKMKPPVHSLFPVGLHGGKIRGFSRALKTIAESEVKTLDFELNHRICISCGVGGWSLLCEACGAHTIQARKCSQCGKLFDAVVEKCQCGGAGSLNAKQQVLLERVYKAAIERVNARPAEVKGVQGLISDAKTPEPLEKGILRASNDVSVFRDGTIRFDATEIPMTHFTCEMAGIDVAQVKKLGYAVDVDGKEITSESQWIELKSQDLILNDEAGEYFLRVSKFIDGLLVNYYGLPAYYNMTVPRDLIGAQAIILAPHTSAGVLCRIIGFTKVRGLLAHPYLHCATRRNCLSAKTMVYYENDSESHADDFEKLFEKYASAYGVENDRGDEIVRPAVSIKAFGSDLQGNYQAKGVKLLMRRKYEGTMLRVVCENNQEIEATPEHRLWVLEKGSLVERAACELKPGDALAGLTKVPALEPNRQEVNLIQLFNERTDAENITIRTNREFCTKLLKEFGGRRGLKVTMGLTDRQISNWMQRGKYAIPLPAFRKMREKMPWLSDEEKKFKIGFKRNFGEINAVIPVDELLGEFLGLYVAEGWCWKSDVKGKESYHVGIAAADAEVRERARYLAKTIFGQKPTVSPKDVIVTNKLLYEFVRSVCGKGAYEKVVPEVILNAGEKTACAFLKGCYQGDGNVSEWEIKYTTVSEKLASQLYFLLTKLGLLATFKKEANKQIKTGLVFEKYRARGLLPPSPTLYYVALYSDDARAFASRVRLYGRKGERLKKLIDGKRGRRLIRKNNDVRIARVKSISPFQYSGYVYDLELDGESERIFACGRGMLLSHNCDGDEDALMLLLDGLLNFSYAYLPASRGGKMDAALVLTTEMDPLEVDDEVHAMDCCASYPLEFYEAAGKFTPPGEMKAVETIRERLGKETQFEGIKFTHTATLAGAPVQSEYVRLGNMAEKLDRELELMKRIRAVDAAGAAERVLLSHFFPDIYGNLRSFGRQSFRCVECNMKHRRVPLRGKCFRCGGKLLLTINRGGVEKYLKLSAEVADKYGLPNYLKQRLVLLGKEIASIFENEQIKQVTLAEFV